VTLEQLRRALSNSLTDESVGIPVALRICLPISDPQTNLLQCWNAALDLADAAFENLRPARLYAQRESNGRQLSVLVTCRGGQTLSVTTGRGLMDKPSLDLVLVGNRGIVRLEGGECLDQECLLQNRSSHGSGHYNPWHLAIERSLREQNAVDVDV
jgi:hypothetical protein